MECAVSRTALPLDASLVGDFLGGAIRVAGTQSNGPAVKVSRAIPQDAQLLVLLLQDGMKLCHLSPEPQQFNLVTSENDRRTGRAGSLPSFLHSPRRCPHSQRGHPRLGFVDQRVQLRPLPSTRTELPQGQQSRQIRVVTPSLPPSAAPPQWLR